MGQKEKNIIKNQAKKAAVWGQKQAEIQRARKPSPYDVYESEAIRKHSLDNGFD